MEQKELEMAQTALALLLKELFLLPIRVKDGETIAVFSNIILDQVEKSFNQLAELTKEEK